MGDYTRVKEYSKRNLIMSIAKIFMLGWVTTRAQRNIQREILSAEISMSTAKISMLGWVTTQAREEIFKKKSYQQKKKKKKRRRRRIF